MSYLLSIWAAGYLATMAVYLFRYPFRLGTAAGVALVCLPAWFWVLPKVLTSDLSIHAKNKKYGLDRYTK